MNCDEFEIVGLDMEREGLLNEEGRQGASQHARVCAKCAALQSSWSVARVELRALGAASRDLAVPSRVETRVLQQFRLKHQLRRDRRMIETGVLALAAAAVIVFTLGVWNLHQWHLRSLASPEGAMPAIAGAGADNSTVNSMGNSTDNSMVKSTSATLSASNLSGSDAGEFTQLPGATFYGAEDETIVRLGMQRASLAAFGLPVNAETADDWIQVDVLVGSDGSPQALRLPQQSEPQ